MNIKILGTGCPNCNALEKRVRKLIDEHKIQSEVTMVKDIMDIMSYNIMSTPALVINENVVIKGRVPSEKELLKLFNS